LQVFKKIMVWVVASGAVHQQKRSLLPVHVRELGHYGCLQGVEIVMVDPVDDQRPSATPIFLETVKSPQQDPP